MVRVLSNWLAVTRRVVLVWLRCIAAAAAAQLLLLLLLLQRDDCLRLAAWPTYTTYLANQCTATTALVMHTCPTLATTSIRSAACFMLL
jgi:hypothetical protein